MSKIKSYFKKRKIDLIVDNFNVWSRLLKMRKKNLIGLLEKEGDNNTFNQRFEMFLSQVFIVHARALDVIENWGLNVTEEEYNRLSGIEYGEIDDVDVLINYLDFLAEELAVRENVKVFNTRFLFFPITKGESLGILIFGIMIAIII